jgi:hypothetical protein
MSKWSGKTEVGKGEPKYLNGAGKPKYLRRCACSQKRNTKWSIRNTSVGAPVCKNEIPNDRSEIPEVETELCKQKTEICKQETKISRVRLRQAEEPNSKMSCALWKMDKR